MVTSRNQRTIRRPVSVEGFGYWSGRDVRVEFRPAPPGAGLAFVRGDLSFAPRIPASVACRVETPRRTTLAARSANVEMVEHVLAALAGLQIDNCEIWVNAPELPGCDGSSQPFVAALATAGVATQDAPRDLLVVRGVTRLGTDESWIEARPASGGLSVHYRLDYGPGNAIGRQTIQLRITPDSFRRELASSRTFVLKQEADWLLAQGLGARATRQDLLVFGAEGPLDNQLRFHDECVRHKVLDLVGDLALAGRDVVGHIVAHKSGHRLNAELVRALLSDDEAAAAERRSA